MQAEADDVGDVGQEKGRKSCDEHVARQHEEHVAEHGQNQGGDEPVTTAGVSRVQGQGHADQGEHHRRLAHVLQWLVGAGDRDPVPNGEGGGGGEKGPGRGGQRRLVLFLAGVFLARRAAAFLAAVRFRGADARPPCSAMS